VRTRAADLGALGALLAAGLCVFTRAWDAATTIDEGVYLASLRELRHGARLGTDVFASQPPLFYWLLRAGAAIFGDSLHGLRLAMLLVALGGVAAVWWIGREAGGPVAAAVAAAAVVVATPYPDEAVLVESDTPSVVLGLLAVGTLLAAARRRSARLYAAAGALFVIAVSVKLLALPFLAALVLLAARRPSRRELAALGGGAVLAAAAVVVSAAPAVGAVWHDAVVFHVHARNEGSWLGPNVRHVIRLPDYRSPFGALLLPAGVIATLLVRRARTPEVLTLWLVAAAAAAFLVLQNPLLDHHGVLLASTLAAAAGTAIGRALPARALVLAGVAAALAVALGHAAVRTSHNADPEPSYVEWAVDVVAADTRPGSLVPTDLPQVAYLAGRRVPAPLTDSSLARTEGGDLSRREILAAVRRAHSPLVVVARAYLTVPGLYPDLRRMYPVRRERPGAIVLEKR
jgi:4-amino-4-deoxy-L-arabinose transferase-like glycosyltransferase